MSDTAEIGPVEQEIIAKGGLSSVFDLSSGPKLGVKLMQNPTTGVGAAIKGVTEDGQAIGAGVKTGDVIAFLNGQDVRELEKLNTIPGIMKSHPKLRLTLDVKDGTFLAL